MNRATPLAAALVALALAATAAPVALDTLTFQPPKGWKQQKGTESWASPHKDATLQITSAPGAAQKVPAGETDPLAYFLKTGRDAHSGWNVTRTGNATIDGEPARYFESFSTDSTSRINSQSFYVCIHNDHLVEYLIRFHHSAGPASQKTTQDVLKSIRWK